MKSYEIFPVGNQWIIRVAENGADYEPVSPYIAYDTEQAAQMEIDRLNDEEAEISLQLQTNTPNVPAIL